MVVKCGALRLQSDLNRAEIAFGPHTFRPDTRQLLRDGGPTDLSGKAFDLLAAFLESDGRVLTRDELYERLWGDRAVEEANLSQTIYLLRRTLDPEGDGRTFIETVPRIGYRFVRPYRRVRAARPRRWAGAVIAAVALFAIVLPVMLRPFLVPHPLISVAARDANEVGEYHLALRTPQNLSYALAHFKEAERAAPSDAFAYAEAGAAYALLAEFRAEGSSGQRELVSLAIASTAEALRRDADSSRAFAVRGFIAYRFQNDRVAAVRGLERALVADPNNAQAHLWRGILSMTEGNLTVATAEFQTAHRIVPTAEIYLRWLARAYAFQGNSQQAIAEARETLQIEPHDAPAMLMIAQAQEQRGDLNAAVETLQELLREDPYERPWAVPDIARLELRIGKANSSLVGRRVDELVTSGGADPFETALVYLTMGRKAAGLQMLRRTDHSTLAIQRYDPRLLALTQHS